jgi:hypothetical protein
MAGKGNRALHLGALAAAAFMATCSGSGGAPNGGDVAPGERLGHTAAALVSTANLRLQEYTSSCGDNEVQDVFQVVNNGTTSIRVSDISIKLWVDETSANSIVASVNDGGCVSRHGASSPDCAGGVVHGVTATAVKMASACGPAPNQQANWEVTITNTSSVSLPPGQAWHKLRTDISLSGHGCTHFSPGTADWYSGCLGGSFADTTHTALYVQGGLVTASTGVPPSCVAPSGTQPVPGSLPPQIANGTFPLVGPLPGTTPITVTISLPLVPQQPGLPPIDDFVDSLYDPTSPNYHQYLTPSQFADAYGADPGSYAQVQSFATAAGLTVTDTYPSRNLLVVSGPASAVESAFFLTMNLYARPDGSVFYAPANDPSVNLAVPLYHIGGLDSYAVPVGASSSGSGPAGCVAITDPGGAHPIPAQTKEFGGSDFKKAYLNSTAQGLFGDHQTLAIIAFDSYDPLDLAAYKNEFNPSATYNVTQIPVIGSPCTTPADCLAGQSCTSGTCREPGAPNGTAPFAPGGNTVDVAGAVEVVLASVPNATVNVYEVSPIPPGGGSVLSSAAYEKVLAAAANETTSPAQVISNSFVWQSLVFDPTIANIFRQYAVQGQSFFQAAGDLGSYVSTGPAADVIANGSLGSVGGQFVPDPIADSALMTVVGATGLTADPVTHVRTAETTWNDSALRGPANATYNAVTGGGLCKGQTGYPALPAPRYQQTLTLSSEIATAQAASGSPFRVRMIPDVSVVGAQISVYARGGFQIDCQEGTSFAAPIWASFAALINQNAGFTPFGHVPTLGYANPKLYNATADLNDINDGSDNDYAATSDGAGAQFHAGTGYDLATGLGSPGNALVGAAALQSQSCMPGANLTALVQGQNVVAYIPNGSWTESTTPDLRVVMIEGNAFPGSVTPYDPSVCNGTNCSCDANGCTIFTTPGDAVNTCSGDSVSGKVVCTGNSNHIYLINGLTISQTMTISPAPQLEFFSGNEFTGCQTCNVAVDPTTHNAFVSIGTGAGAALQPIIGATAPSGSPSFGTSINMNGASETSEGIMIDPTRQLLLSPNEEGDFQAVQFNTSETTSTVYDFNVSGAPIFDQAAEDCSTGIALASVEIFGTSTGGTTQLFLLDLTQAPFPGGGSWSPPANAYNLLTVPEFSAFVAGTDALTIASPSHLGAITGEFGGNAFGVFLLPASSGIQQPNLQDYVVAQFPTTPDGHAWAMGLDPHTLTSYTSPNNNKQYAVFQDDWDGNGARTYLAVVDMARLLFEVPRSDGLTPSTGTTSHTIDAATLQAPGMTCNGPPAGTPGCVVGWVHN